MFLIVYILVKREFANSPGSAEDTHPLCWLTIFLRGNNQMLLSFIALSDSRRESPRDSAVPVWVLASMRNCWIRPQHPPLTQGKDGLRWSSCSSICKQTKAKPTGTFVNNQAFQSFSFNDATHSPLLLLKWNMSQVWGLFLCVCFFIPWSRFRTITSKPVKISQIIEKR